MGSRLTVAEVQSAAFATTATQAACSGARTRPRVDILTMNLPARDNGNGYMYVSINRRPIAVHRVAWAVETGRWPIEVDHRDTDKSNNRWPNLREATRSQNEMNGPRRTDNTSGFKGVGWHKCKSSWRAYIQKDGRHIHLGYFDTPELASAAYATNAARLFGEFARV